MGLKIETWSIAYRKKRDGLLLEDGSDFKIINNGHKGWYADPFLFDYNGKTYLFAEFFSYKLGRGIIVYSEYDESKECFKKYQPIIIEDYHLSYPNVFVWNNKIYMIPEAHKSESVYLYEAVNFPHDWKKVKVLMRDIKLVDTTPFEINGSLKAITMQIDKDNPKHNNVMMLLDIDKDTFEVSNCKVVTDNISLARPGGKVIKIDNELIFVTQDCKEEYGKSLNFIKVCDIDKTGVTLRLVKKINTDQIAIINGSRASGIHTYNISNNLEVIDLKYYRRSYYRILLKIFQKIFK